MRRINRTREIYDARASFPFDGHTCVEEITQAVNLLCVLEPNFNARICDIGCGGGWHIRELYNRGYRCLYGIDLSAKSLVVASRVCRNTSAIFFHQDISASWQADFFDFATVFNATLGSGGRASDLAFIRGIAAQLRPGGRLLLTYFPRELAALHIGRFSISYCKSRKSQVISTVEFDPRKSELWIHQEFGDMPIPSECLHLYSRSEMESLLSVAGLRIQHATLQTESQLARSGVDCIVAMKTNE